MDSSFDKYNDEFKDQQKTGIKVTILLVLAYIFALGGLVITVLTFVYHNSYVSLGGLVCALLSFEALFKAKSGDWRLKTLIPLIIDIVVIAVAFVMLYIVGTKFTKKKK